MGKTTAYREIKSGKTRRRIIETASALIILLLSPLLTRAQGPDLSVDGAVRLAMRNNTTVANAERARLIYKEKIREYWGGVYPQLSASAQYTRNIEKSSIFFGGNKIAIGSDNAYAASLDLNDATLALNRAQTFYTQARHDACSAAAELIWAVGE